MLVGFMLVRVLLRSAKHLFLATALLELPDIFLRGRLPWHGYRRWSASRRRLEQPPYRDHQRDEDHDGEGDGTALFKAGHSVSSSFAHAFQASLPEA